MARLLRIEFPDAVYYVTSRGNAKGMIFGDEQDRQKFLYILGSVVKKHRWLCHTSCLMGNHYHLLIETPENWPWPSYRATAGRIVVSELLTTDWTHAQFTSTRRESCHLYRAFVYQGDGQPSPWTNLRRGVFLGGESFVCRFKAHLAKKKGQKEILRYQRLLHRQPLDYLLTTETESRAWAAREAYVAWGYTLKEIAGFWGIHYSTVSRMIKKGAEAM